jgi:hypothetical protein
MSVYVQHVTQWKKMLQCLDKWLDKAEEHAKKKSFDPDVYLGLRLAPDMFPLVRQIQSACDTAKNGAARLAGKDPPSHPDTEKTIADVRSRIATCLAYLEGFSAKDFEGADDRKIFLPFLQGNYVLGSDYLAEFVMPNFYFHATTAYALLRHAGVDVGKRDFIGAMSVRTP